MTKTTTKDLWDRAANQVQQAQATVPQTHPSDRDYVPPAADVKLPSRGVVYDPSNPLYMMESVQINPVSAKEEDILSDSVLVKNGTVLTVLMRACITNRSIDPELMLVGDRNAILVSIRISAYGPMYEVQVSCPECLEVCSHAFNLGLLKLKMLEEVPSKGNGSNVFEFTLPLSKRTVSFKLLDAESAIRLDKEQEAIRKKTDRERNVTTRLREQVLSMSGVDAGSLGVAIDNMAARDARALRHHMDEVAPGVDMKQPYHCRKCGKTNEVEIPLGPEFFWPSGPV